MQIEGPPNSYEATMLSKEREVAKVQGEAAVDLIKSVAKSDGGGGAPPPGTGTMVNDVA